MTSETTKRIKAFAKDPMQQDGLIALMDYYGVDNLLSVNEEMGLEFLAKLTNGEITLN